jgi:hypothetical protein
LNVQADENLKSDNTNLDVPTIVITDPNAEFTKEYQRQISSSGSTAAAADEDASYHDKVLQRFSKMK